MRDGASASRVGQALRACRRELWTVGLFSALVNLLTLNGSIYMLQVYDRVLVARSVPTLVTLTALLVGLFLIQGGLDLVRQRLTGRIARLFDAGLRRPAHDAALRNAAGPESRTALQPVRDVDAVRGFLTGNGPAALMDLPFAPVFLALVFLVHPWMGVLSLAGAAVLVALTFASERFSRRAAAQALAETARQQQRGETMRRNAESALAMGLGPALAARWDASARTVVDATEAASDVVGGYGVASRTVRMLLQSLVLGLGAYLTIEGEVTGGAMIASSILVGRALAPVEQVIAQWRGMLQAREAARRLATTLGGAETSVPTALPAPLNSLAVEGVTVAAPSGATILAGIDFALSAGDVLGVVGPSGAGKSSLVRGLLGLWKPARGSVRLDGATLDQWGFDRLGPHLGYVAQQVGLFDGTIAENIARMAREPDPAMVIAAARAAGVHELILQLPEGYDTPIGEASGPLSAGQRQRVALARALYGNPFLIVLDEANANLDPAGEAAFLEAVKAAAARGAIVILISHRPAALSVCSKILVLGDREQKAFGPRDAILKPMPSRPDRPQPIRAAG